MATPSKHVRTAGELPRIAPPAHPAPAVRAMVLLRRFESVAQVACRKGETPGFLHLYIGEEASDRRLRAPAPTDWVTSTHRGHGHALAKGADPRRVMAELFGKARRHLRRPRRHHASLRPRVGLFGTNGIVGAGIGHAVGIGLGAARAGPRRHRRSPSSATARRTTAPSTRR